MDRTYTYIPRNIKYKMVVVGDMNHMKILLGSIANKTENEPTLTGFHQPFESHPELYTCTINGICESSDVFLGTIMENSKKLSLVVSLATFPGIVSTHYIAGGEHILFGQYLDAGYPDWEQIAYKHYILSIADMDKEGDATDAS